MFCGSNCEIHSTRRAYYVSRYFCLYSFSVSDSSLLLMPCLISSRSTVLSCRTWRCKISKHFICMSVSVLLVLSYFNWSRASWEAFVLRTLRSYFLASPVWSFLGLILPEWASIRSLSTLLFYASSINGISFKCAVALLTYVVTSCCTHLLILTTSSLDLVTSFDKPCMSVSVVSLNGSN